MENSIVIVVSALLIAGIVWWFFSKRDVKQEEAIMSESKQHVNVTVEGGYMPQTVVLRQGVPAQIVFNRKNPSSCFDEVVFPDFGIKEKLPVNQTHAIDIDTSKAGEYDYACGMNMFHGKVVIK